MNRIKTSFAKKSGLIFTMAAIAILVRLYLNFSNELLSGNGGYYPLQVRTLLERGELGFSDMPLLFYLNAGTLKLLSFFGATITDDLIFNTIKFMDAVLYPLIFIPFYFLVRLTALNIKPIVLGSITGYLLLSFIPFSLLGSFQKNAFAIVLFFTAITFWHLYFQSKTRKYLWWTIAFLVATALSHFGTFMFALLFFGLFLLVRYRVRALVPILITFCLGVFFVFLFDPERGERVGEFLVNSLSGNALKAGVRIPQIAKWLFFGSTAVISVILMRKYKRNFNPFESAVIWTSIILLFIVPVPFYDGQFVDRLTTFLFVPQCILLLYFAPHLRKRAVWFISIALIVISSLSTGLVLFENRPPEVSDKVYADLSELKLSDPANTIIVSRHNLEFWVAWALKAKVSQESAYEESFKTKYKHVLILNQTKGLREHHGPGGANNPFSEPDVPNNSTLIDSTEYFKLYEVR